MIFDFENIDLVIDEAIQKCQDGEFTMDLCDKIQLHEFLVQLDIVCCDFFCNVDRKYSAIEQSQIELANWINRVLEA